MALFGANMGPASIVTLQVSNGTVTNSLAGTQVLFDGVAAPMVYTLNGQVSAVVPYGVAGKTSTQVQVQYQGAVSNTADRARAGRHAGHLLAGLHRHGTGRDSEPGHFHQFHRQSRRARAR